MILLFCSSRMTVSKAATAFLDLLTEIAMLPNNILGVFIKSIRKSIEIACEKFLFNVCRHKEFTRNSCNLANVRACGNIQVMRTVSNLCFGLNH